MLFDGHWIPIRDGDPRALGMYLRHYSCHQYRDNRRAPGAWRQVRKIMGPGEYMLLMTEDARALFGWLRPMVETLDRQAGVRCSVFRNEGELLSSGLVREACELAWERWPGERLYTYIDPRKVQSRNPGYCFLVAGWRRCGVTKVNRLLVLEILA